MIINFQYLELTYCFVVCTLPFVFKIDDLKHYDGDIALPSIFQYIYMYNAYEYKKYK